MTDIPGYLRLLAEDAKVEANEAQADDDEGAFRYHCGRADAFWDAARIIENGGPL